MYIVPPVVYTHIQPKAQNCYFKITGWGCEIHSLGEQTCRKGLYCSLIQCSYGLSAFVDFTWFSFHVFLFKYYFSKVFSDILQPSLNNLTFLRAYMTCKIFFGVIISHLKMREILKERQRKSKQPPKLIQVANQSIQIWTHTLYKNCLWH